MTYKKINQLKINFYEWLNEDEHFIWRQPGCMSVPTGIKRCQKQFKKYPE